MQAWLDAEGRFFNPRPRVQVLPIWPGQVCVVVDDLLAHPQGLVDWAAGQRFEDPAGYPYPGQVFAVPPAIAQLMAEAFALHARGLLNARRTLDHTVRLSLVSTPPELLDPRQWQCHRDRVVAEPSDIVFAASVLYLFHDPALGGTSFYRARRPAHEIDAMLADSQQLDGPGFSARHGVQPGYMVAGNAHFEQVARVPAAYNRAIFYDGGIFHSADVDQPQRLSRDPRQGRLTLNGFYTCRRKAA